MPVLPICTSCSASAGICWPAATGCPTRIADTRSPLAMTKYALVSAPPRINRTASAASAGLRSRGGTGSRCPGPEVRPELPEMAAEPAGAVAAPPAVDWLVLMTAATPGYAYVRKRAVANHVVALDKLSSMDVGNRRHLVTICTSDDHGICDLPMVTPAR